MAYVKISDLKVNEAYKSALPELSSKEFNLLMKSIDTDGIQIPIIIDYDNVILDGHHRIAACEELGVTYVEAQQMDSEEMDVVRWIKEIQLARRNMTIEARNELIRNKVAQIKEELGERRGGDTTGAKRSDDLIAKDPENTGKSTNEIVAEKLQEEGVMVSPKTVQRVVAKDKPVKPKKLRQTHNVVVIFTKSVGQLYTPHRFMFQSKKAAKEYVEESMKNSNSDDPSIFDNQTVNYAYAEVDFFTLEDQQRWEDWNEEA